MSIELKNNIKALKERIIWGGDHREGFLIDLLLKYYDSKLYREWSLAKEQPHFFNQRAGIFQTIFGRKAPGFYSYARGFFAAEVIQGGDIVLDIGCGDGFFTKRFFSTRPTWIDAIDIEPAAIEACKKYNYHKKINYLLMDAVKDPFPHAAYDVIIWDGAIGHFPKETTETMLKKITLGLNHDGVFCGSESLGEEGHDHLQFFMDEKALADLFKPFFKYVEVRSQKFMIPSGERWEGYWRCSNKRDRLQQASWKQF